MDVRGSNTWLLMYVHSAVMATGYFPPVTVWSSSAESLSNSGFRSLDNPEAGEQNPSL